MCIRFFLILFNEEVRVKARGIDDNKRTVTTCIPTACYRVYDLATIWVAVYFLSILMATSRYVSLINN